MTKLFSFLKWLFGPRKSIKQNLMEAREPFELVKGKEENDEEMDPPTN